MAEHQRGALRTAGIRDIYQLFVERNARFPTEWRSGMAPFLATLPQRFAGFATTICGTGRLQRLLLLVSRAPQV